MKRIIFLLILTSICLKANAQNQIIKANPLGLVFGIANLGIEFSGKTNKSTTVSALYYAKSDTKGFGIGIEQRFYFNANKSLKGFHAGPNAGYLRLSDNYNDNFNVFSIGAEIGYQWFLNKNFTVDLFSGANFLFNSNLQLSLGVGLSLGYAW